MLNEGFLVFNITSSFFNGRRLLITKQMVFLHLRRQDHERANTPQCHGVVGLVIECRGENEAWHALPRGREVETTS